MTASRLQNAALIRFAAQGFDATTMNEIASDVGIKKASIYAHFTNKDALFLSLIPLMIEHELDYLQAVIKGGSQLKSQLYQYLESIEQRFLASSDMQFWLRTLFAPPSHLYEESMAPMHEYMDQIEHYMVKVMVDSPFANLQNGLTVSTLVASYMAMIDSLQTELLFGGSEKYQRRLSSLWQLFEVAIDA